MSHCLMVNNLSMWCSRNLLRLRIEMSALSPQNQPNRSSISSLFGDSQDPQGYVLFSGKWPCDSKKPDKTPQQIGSNSELFKNQYRPMKKGVTNMIRLHATGAIAMPIEIRLHILASSKDVIHS